MNCARFVFSAGVEKFRGLENIEQEWSASAVTVQVAQIVPTTILEVKERLKIRKFSGNIVLNFCSISFVSIFVLFLFSQGG